jgi:hypothetical protein
MAKKTSKKAAPKADAPVAGEVAASTPARKTVKPRATKAVVTPITHERIAERAYYISLTGRGGSEVDNWHLAEDELRREGGAV